MFQSLPSCFDFFLAVIGKIINPRKQRHRRRILDDEAVAVHSRRAAVAGDSGHAGVAPGVDGRLQTSFVNQALFVEVCLCVALSATACASSTPAESATASSPPAPSRCARRHRDAHIHRLSSRSGETLDDQIFRPRSKSLANPLAALIRPVDLHLGAFEINRAKIILNRRAFRKLKTHRKSRAAAESHAAGSSQCFMPSLVTERRGFVVFPIQQQLPHLRKTFRDFGRLGGTPARYIQHLMAERNLFRVRIAFQLNAHAAIAGEECAIAGRKAAKAPLRHKFSPNTFRQRHGRDPDGACRLANDRRLWQQWLALYAAQVIRRSMIARQGGSAAASRENSRGPPAARSLSRNRSPRRRKRHSSESPCDACVPPINPCALTTRAAVIGPFTWPGAVQILRIRSLNHRQIRTHAHGLTGHN